MLNIILFGAPGAGKGTQAKRLASSFNLHHISTGEVIRQEIKDGTELGLSVKDHIARGELAPDEMVLKMVDRVISELKDSRNGFIFDGFPRTTVQAVEFDRILAKSDMAVDLMLSLEVPNDELMKRLLLRGENSGRPEDGYIEVIQNRLDIYRETTVVVANYYSAQNKHIPIDGIGDIDDIFQRLFDEVERVEKAALRQ